MLKPDSLIFDRDGTLWDNVDTYVAAWNKGLEAKGYDLRLRREDLVGLMGKEIGKMLNRFFPEISPEEEKELFNAIVEAYQSLTKTMTPKIFPGVREGLEKLATKYKLFMLSNCEKGGDTEFHELYRHASPLYGLYGTWSEFSTQKLQSEIIDR
jgi:phosphoglycolate phosphatase